MASLSTLPPEIFDKILEQLAIDYQADPLHYLVKPLYSLSLVQKKFYLPIARRQWEKINLFSLPGRVRKFISCLLSNGDLVTFVKRLELHNYGLNSELLLQDFIQLIQLLPSLTTLKIGDAWSLLRQQNEELKLPVLTEIVSLRLNFSSRRIIGGDPITQFVNSTSTPKLKVLDLYIDFTQCTINDLPYST